MKIKTNLLEGYVILVDLTKKQNKQFKLNFNFVCEYFPLFFFVLFECLTEEHVFSTTNIENQPT